MSDSSKVLKLPKPYLSYSAIDCWLKSPKTFRKRYYEKAPFFSTPELRFGKFIADELETNGSAYPDVPQLSKPEQQIQIEIEGIPLFGYIDSFDPETKGFYEYKTGRVPWTQKRVDSHLQLDIYSLAIEEIFGSVQDECKLVWMETKKMDEQLSGLVTHEDSHTIELTGKVVEFDRVIDDAKRQETRELIVRVAQEISDDFAEWSSDRAEAQAEKETPKSGLF